MPSWAGGYPFYRSGVGTVELYRELYSPLTITKTEIWVGTYDVKRGKSQFFCNRGRSQSLLGSRWRETAFLYGALPLRWCNGDVDRIARTTLASASIPMVVPPQNVDGGEYLDGGITYSSPLVPFAHNLYRLAQHRGLRLYYIAPYHIEAPEGLTGWFVSRLVKTAIHSSVLEDRCAAVNLLYRISPEGAVNYTSHHSVTTSSLKRLLQQLEAVRHYVIILYPHRNAESGPVGVPIRSFTSTLLLARLSHIRERYGVHVWTVG
jgi:hypothetical protein